jgi:branched-subunit amino acid transport protein
MPELIAMILLGLASWVLRVTFVLFLPPDRLPAVLQRGLQYLPPAVLAGIAAVELTSVVTGGNAAGLAASLLAMALVALIAYLTRNLTAVVVVGLLTILLIDLVIT